jgi:chromosome segregation ATPase
MEIAEAKKESIRVTSDLIRNSTEMNELREIFLELTKKRFLCKNRKEELLKQSKKLEETIEAEIDAEYNELNKICEEYRNKMHLCRNRKEEILKEIKSKSNAKGSSNKGTLNSWK